MKKREIEEEDSDENQSRKLPLNNILEVLLFNVFKFYNILICLYTFNRYLVLIIYHNLKHYKPQI